MITPDQLPHEQRAREWMAFDPLDTAYHIDEVAGIDDERATYGLGYALMLHAAEQKKMFLSEMGDTYYRMPWDDALEIFSECGFETIKQEDRCAEDYPSIRFRRLLAATADKRMVLSANGSNLHDRWVLDHGTEIRMIGDSHGDKEVMRKLHKNGHSQFLVGEVNDYSDWRFALSFTVTEGMKMILRDIHDSGIELIDWPTDERLARSGFDPANLANDGR